MFTEKNKRQIKAQGLSEKEIERQLHIFKTGIPFVDIVQPVSPESGINVVNRIEQEEYVKHFEQHSEDLELIKFVPASGAATRMFKFLHEFLRDFDYENADIDDFLKDSKNHQAKEFFDSMEDFAFHSLILKNLKLQIRDYDSLNKGEKLYSYVKEMLGEKGLNFSNTPKGLIPFYKSDSGFITPFGAQLYEGLHYATSKRNVKLHFTVSEEHIEKFENRFQEIKQEFEERTDHQFDISYSFQKKQTDTIAATLDNQPFLDENSDLIFRPSGHGALLDNLNNLDADLIFIKNIDNVVSEKHIKEIIFQKKMLAGKLLNLQKKIFQYVQILNHEEVSESQRKEISSFIRDKLFIEPKNSDKEVLLKILERPIRICGVVENTGAPGGGPFVVKDEDGSLSLQIVEMSQIDIENAHYKELVDKATHFNPVDLVCGVRNYKGEKYNLMEFADPKLAFISKKSYHGKKLKALELPGLWNGAMAKWNTIFVEVPLITFNPVKTVNDLLNIVHQA